jgi:hypothetical protein
VVEVQAPHSGNRCDFWLQTEVVAVSSIDFFVYTCTTKPVPCRKACTDFWKEFEQTQQLIAMKLVFLACLVGVLLVAGAQHR